MKVLMYVLGFLRGITLLIVALISFILGAAMAVDYEPKKPERPDRVSYNDIRRDYDGIYRNYGKGV